MTDLVQDVVSLLSMSTFIVTMAMSDRRDVTIFPSPRLRGEGREAAG